MQVGSAEGFARMLIEQKRKRGALKGRQPNARDASAVPRPAPPDAESQEAEAGRNRSQQDTMRLTAG